MNVISTLCFVVCLPCVIISDTAAFIVPGCPSKATLVAEQSPKFLTSPNYPGDYGAFNVLSCVWLITAGDIYDDVVIQIQVLNSSLEPATGCWRDAVCIIDGPRDYYAPLKTWCGSSWPTETLTSSDNSVLVKFSTDFKMNDYYGFMLAYWVAKKPVLIVNPIQWSAINYTLLAVSLVLLIGGPSWVAGLYFKRELYPKHVKYWRENQRRL